MRVEPCDPARQAVCQVVGQALDLEADGVAPPAAYGGIELSKPRSHIHAFLLEGEHRLEAAQPLEAIRCLQPARQLVELMRGVGQPLIENLAIKRPCHGINATPPLLRPR